MPTSESRSRGWMSAYTAAYLRLVVVGLVIGVLAALLQKFGNPPNMGICVACFERDIAGALGLHSLVVARYIRPEVIGFVLGALFAAFSFRGFKPRTGSTPIARFFLGVFAMIGALVFLGCSWRVLLRLAGGDGNAVLGLAGLTVGVGIAVYFHRRGYTLGPARRVSAITGMLMPSAMVVLLLFLILKFPSKDGRAIFESAQGVGAMHAPIWLSLGAGLLIGFIARQTRFCTIGAISDTISIGDFRQVFGVGALVVGAFAANLILKQFHPGVTGQPIAHSNHVWNFLGMVLAGLAFALAGGCPGRQLVLCGEGDGDAAVFVWGAIVGAALSHNLALAGVPDRVVEGVLVGGGPGVYGKIAVLVGLAFCVILGATARREA